MNRIDVKLKYKKHIWTKYSNGSFSYNSYQVNYIFTNLSNREICMDITILTDSVNSGICPVFVEIIDFMYLACGTMPIIIYYKDNNKDIALEQISCRFFPAMKYFKNENLIDISNQTLNESTLTNIQNIVRNKPFEIFSAFTALTSSAYEEIYIEHRIALLLHCFEGYIYNKDSYYQKNGITFKDRINEILKVLFDYDKKYNTEILKTLNFSEDGFLQTLTDTRHQFSHYIIKNSPLTEDNYLVTFFLLHYIFRLYVIKEINLVPNEKNIEEFLKSIYDWLNVLNNSGFKNFKSITYAFNYAMQQLKP